jgi:hypothetical protein
MFDTGGFDPVCADGSVRSDAHAELTQRRAAYQSDARQLCASRCLAERTGIEPVTLRLAKPIWRGAEPVTLHHLFVGLSMDGLALASRCRVPMLQRRL